MNPSKPSGRSQPSPEPEILIQRNSPSCPISAFVEQDGQTAYLYLQATDGHRFGTRACWVRNLVAGPKEILTQAMDGGAAPLQPADFCFYPQGQAALKTDDLTLVWFEEGDAVALLEREEIIAIVPGWSGTDTFCGYARDAAGQGPFAWALTSDNPLIQRVINAHRYWESWSEDPDPFRREQPVIMKAYEELFGQSSAYYAIDGGEFPPRGLYVRNGPQKLVIATVGMSLLPMPLVEQYFEDTLAAHRIELGMMLDGAFSTEAMQTVGGWISGQAGAPWNQVTFLGEGHTIEFKVLENNRFTNVVLTNQLSVLPKVDLGTFRDAAVNLLYAVPISERERLLLTEEGSAALIAGLEGIGEAIFSLDRTEMV